MLTKLRIPHRLGLGFGVVLVLLAVLAGVSYYSLDTASDYFDSYRPGTGSLARTGAAVRWPQDPDRKNS